jgi:hypothetical protein
MKVSNIRNQIEADDGVSRNTLNDWQRKDAAKNARETKHRPLLNENFHTVAQSWLPFVFAMKPSAAPKGCATSILLFFHQESFPDEFHPPLGRVLEEQSAAA